MKHDPVNHPTHYTSHPSGVECIEVKEWLPSNLGDAWKYLHRNGLKDAPPLQDLKKCFWYLKRELRRRVTLARMGQRLDFYCPDNVFRKVAKIMKFESGIRRQILSGIWLAATKINDREDLQRAITILETHISLEDKSENFRD